MTGRRSTDQASNSGLASLACPGCGRPLKVYGDELMCTRRHRYEVFDGIFDLWPPDRPAPERDWFSTPYGTVYDAAIKERWLARIGGRLGWGTSFERMYQMMDEGVKCEPGEVVLDVPVGGAPPLRSAAGRLRGTYIGIDLSEAMLRRAAAERHSEGLENVILGRGDAAHLPIADASVDRILCFNGLHVMPDKGAVLAEFHRVLKPGGSVLGNVVIVGSTSRPWLSRSGLFFHPANAGELEALAYAAGFESWEPEPEGSMLYFKAAKAG
jgi:ubiquinone/menaquinone biosynthesis C-methylase UbiE